MPVLESEKELENYLLSLPWDEKHPLNMGFRDGQWVALSQVRISPYGIMDLVLLHVTPENWSDPSPIFEIYIVELKKGKLDFTALGQLFRYRIGLTRLMADSNLKYRCDIYGILVGNDYADGDACYMAESIDWLSVIHYDLTLQEGLSLKVDTEEWCENGDCGAADFPFTDWFDERFEETKAQSEEFYKGLQERRKPQPKPES